MAVHGNRKLATTIFCLLLFVLRIGNIADVIRDFHLYAAQAAVKSVQSNIVAIYKIHA